MEGSSKDLRVYENVLAIVQTGESHHQVPIGTLVQVGDVWRVIDAPEGVAGGEENLASGFFFRMSMPGRTEQGGSEPDKEAERLLAELEKLDQTAESATAPEQKANFNARRASLLETIAEQVDRPEDRSMWVRQLADMVSAAVQSGTYPQGAARLEALFKKLDAGSATDKGLAPYVKFRQLTAAYALSLQAPKPDFAQIQAQWLKDLEQYVADYPTADDSAEALLQLGIAQEFAGQEDKAKEFYAKVVQSFPRASAARKAAGAGTRLDSVGKSIGLAGKSPSGGVVDLAKYRGKVVLVQYWATWSESAKRDMPALKELQAKYGGAFSVIGVNLDSDRKELEAYLAGNRLPWPQIFEEGGLDSPPANRLGILTLPTMILVDKDGKVVDHNIQTADLEEALKKLIGTPVARKTSGRGAGNR
ncbi:MAG: hypothetical protein A2V70_11695 [Planctomycetes bacterium RBG_13_63_9]|nr:MAG: hypothetical protein A2V70_11695 [Planctomycetes bacterium RBG_13_63_9]